MDVATSTMEKLGVYLRYALSPILLILSLIYYIGYIISKNLHSKFQVKFPNLKILCVGNPTLGGSGKTVIVERLVKDLQLKGKKVAVVIRGYKRKSKVKSVVVLNPTENIANLYVYDVGDEAFMLFEKCRVPVGVSADRVRSIQLLLKFSPEIIISDDGYQNFRFYKDVNVLVINLCDFKSKDLYLLPLGKLREPLNSAVKRANYIILNHSQFVSFEQFQKVVNLIKKIKKDVKIISTYYKIQYFASVANSKKQFKCNEFLLLYPNVSLACGIGKPELFVKTLESEGFRVVHKFFYLDHYWYKTKDVKKWCDISNYPIVLTYKDVVRVMPLVEQLEGMYVNKLYYCDIKLEFNEGEKVWEEMLSTL